MMRTLAVLAGFGLACVSRSESRARVVENEGSARDEASVRQTSRVPPAEQNATESRTFEPEALDAPPQPPDRPTTPRTVFPILEARPEGDGARVTLGIGSRQGVTKTWKFLMIDREGHALSSGDLAIISIGVIQTYAHSVRPPSAIPKDVRAKVFAY